MLLEYVKSEYAVFCVLLKLMIDMKCKQIHGNVLAQVIHDDVTMANHKKSLSLALQLIDPFWEKNLLLCCGFADSKNNKRASIADFFKRKSKSITGHHLTDIMGIMVIDWAAV